MASDTKNEDGDDWYYLYWSDNRMEKLGRLSEPSRNPLDARIDWRSVDRVRTSAAVLVVCLRLGFDPPDVTKTDPCAKLECWVDPYSLPRDKAMERIGKNLQRQFEGLAPTPKIRHRLYLDPPIDEVRKFSTMARKSAKNERVLYYYNGHGVPKPTTSGELWLFNRQYTQYIPLSLTDIVQWIGVPAVYIWDCSCAGNLVKKIQELVDDTDSADSPVPDYSSTGPKVPQSTSSNAADVPLRDLPSASPENRAYDAHMKRFFTKVKLPNVMDEIIQLAACQSHETLPINAELPADLFTCCLTTPIEAALRFFVLRNPLKSNISLDMIMRIPGKPNDRRTPLGELIWIFTAVTDTIAWNTLPRDLFQRLFRQDLLVAALFRGFLLAERIMRFYNCTPMSVPKLPETHTHSMWGSWDLAVELCLAQLPGMLAYEKVTSSKLDGASERAKQGASSSFYPEYPIASRVARESPSLKAMFVQADTMPYVQPNLDASVSALETQIARLSFEQDSSLARVNECQQILSQLTSEMDEASADLKAKRTTETEQRVIRLQNEIRRQQEALVLAQEMHLDCQTAMRSKKSLLEAKNSRRAREASNGSAVAPPAFSPHQFEQVEKLLEYESQQDDLQKRFRTMEAELSVDNGNLVPPMALLQVSPTNVSAQDPLSHFNIKFPGVRPDDPVPLPSTQAEKHAPLMHLPVALPYVNSTFFAEQLNAFEIWLDSGANREQIHPEQLPIVLQVLLSQAHRLKALILLCKFLDLGPWAVNIALTIGIFAYVLRLLQAPAAELRPVLIYIWTRILAVYDSCKEDLLKHVYPPQRGIDNAPFHYFVNVLGPSDFSLPIMNVSEHRAMCAFILAICCRNARHGQIACLRSNTLSFCLAHLSSPDAQLRTWAILCIAQLWADFDEAMGIGLSERAHESLILLLMHDKVPDVRAACLYALSTLLGAQAYPTVSSGGVLVQQARAGRSIASLGPASGIAPLDQLDIELGIAMGALKSAFDGSSVVRRELVIMLSAVVHRRRRQFVIAAYAALVERHVIFSQTAAATSSSSFDSQFFSSNDKDHIASQLRDAIKLDQGPSNPALQATIFSCIFRYLILLAADPVGDVRERAQAVVDRIHEMLFQSTLGPHARDILDYLGEESMRTDSAGNATRRNSARDSASATDEGSFSRAPPHIPTPRGVYATRAPGHWHPRAGVQPPDLRDPSPKQPSASALLRRAKRAPLTEGTSPKDAPQTAHASPLSMPSPGDPFSGSVGNRNQVEDIVAELLEQSEEALNNERLYPSSVEVSMYETDATTPPHVSTYINQHQESAAAPAYLYQVPETLPTLQDAYPFTDSPTDICLPLKSFFFDVAKEYYTEPQMRPEDSSEAGSLCNNERSWRRDRNDAMIKVTSAYDQRAGIDSWNTLLGSMPFQTLTSVYTAPFDASETGHYQASTTPAYDTPSLNSSKRSAIQAPFPHVLPLTASRFLKPPKSLHTGPTVVSPSSMAGAAAAISDQKETPSPRTWHMPFDLPSPTATAHSSATYTYSSAFSESEYASSQAVASLSGIMPSSANKSPLPVSSLVSAATPATHMLFHQFEPSLVATDATGIVTTYDWIRQSQTSRFSLDLKPRVSLSSMRFVNEDDASILMLGSSDGVVRLVSNYSTNKPTLVTGFRAADELTPSSTRAAGLQCEWLQQRGILVAAGAMRHIRIFDAASETILKDLPTRSNSCITSLTTDYNALIVAGFGDGAVRIYDQRLSNRDATIATFKGTHSSWIAGVHMQRGAGRELISAAYQGNVAFWDARTPSQPQKSNIAFSDQPLTCFGVHDNTSVYGAATPSCLKLFNTAFSEPITKLTPSTTPLASASLPTVLSAPELTGCFTFHQHHKVLACAIPNSIELYALDNTRHLYGGF